MRRALKRLKSGKALGPDDIPGEVSRRYLEVSRRGGSRVFD